jgi:hypothetical protein
MEGRGGSEWQDDECILSQKVQDAIAEVLPSDDPIDQANFDAIEFINQNFPSDDQKSLEKIEPFVTTLSENITKLDGELSSAVQKQATAGHRAAEDIRDANQAIHELFTKIKDIKGKAEQSEVMVAEICKDIKQLDYAKRHIQETITALKRLHMVVTAVEQLKAMSSTKQYREAANLLEAVKQLLTHFADYSNIPKILELKSNIEKLRSDLKTQVFKDFMDIGELGEIAEEDSPNESTLIAACAVIDALGETEKEELVATFIHQQMRPYALAFKKGKEEAGLGGTDRRYAWFRRVLKGVDTRIKDVFPTNWKVPYKLCLAFCEETQKSLRGELGDTSPEAVEQIDVAVLLRALQRTLHFEKEMSSRFETDMASMQVCLCSTPCLLPLVFCPLSFVPFSWPVCTGRFRFGAGRGRQTDRRELGRGYQEEVCAGGEGEGAEGEAEAE